MLKKMGKMGKKDLTQKQQKDSEEGSEEDGFWECPTLCAHILQVAIYINMTSFFKFV